MTYSALILRYLFRTHGPRLPPEIGQTLLKIRDYERSLTFYMQLSRKIFLPQFPL